DGLPAPDRAPVEPEAVLERVLGQLVGRHREVLPGSEHVDEAQVDHADLLLADEVNDVLGLLFAHGWFRCSGAGVATAGEAGPSVEAERRSLSERRLAALIGADANRLEDRDHEDLSVADPIGGRDLADRCDDLFGSRRGYHDLD